MFASTIVKLLQTGKIVETDDLLCVLDKDTDPVVLFNGILTDYSYKGVGSRYGWHDDDEDEGKRLRKDDALGAVFRYMVVNFPDKAEATFDSILDASVFDNLQAQIRRASDYIREKGEVIVNAKVDRDIKPRVVKAFQDAAPVYFHGNTPAGLVGDLIDGQTPLVEERADTTIKSTFDRTIDLFIKSAEKWNAAKTIWLNARNKPGYEIGNLAYIEMRVPVKLWKGGMEKEVSPEGQEYVDAASYVTLTTELELTRYKGCLRPKLKVDTKGWGATIASLPSAKISMYGMPVKTKDRILNAAKRVVVTAFTAKVPKMETKPVNFLHDDDTFKMVLGAHLDEDED